MENIIRIASKRRTMDADQIRNYFYEEFTEPNYAVSWVESDETLKHCFGSSTHLLAANPREIERLMDRMRSLKWLNVEIIANGWKFSRSLTIFDGRYYLFCNASYEGERTTPHVLTAFLDLDDLQRDVCEDMLQYFDEDFLLENKYLARLR